MRPGHSQQRVNPVGPARRATRSAAAAPRRPPRSISRRCPGPARRRRAATLRSPTSAPGRLRAPAAPSSVPPPRPAVSAPGPRPRASQAPPRTPSPHPVSPPVGRNRSGTPAGASLPAASREVPSTDALDEDEASDHEHRVPVKLERGPIPAESLPVVEDPDEGEEHGQEADEQRRHQQPQKAPVAVHGHQSPILRASAATETARRRRRAPGPPGSGLRPGGGASPRACRRVGPPEGGQLALRNPPHPPRSRAAPWPGIR